MHPPTGLLWRLLQTYKSQVVTCWRVLMVLVYIIRSKEVPSFFFLVQKGFKQVLTMFHGITRKSSGRSNCYNNIDASCIRAYDCDMGKGQNLLVRPWIVGPFSGVKLPGCCASTRSGATGHSQRGATNMPIPVPVVRVECQLKAVRSEDCGEKHGEVTRRCGCSVGFMAH